MLDKVTATREEERYLQTYQVGQHVEFTRGVPSQGISAGEATVSRIDHDKGRVELSNERGGRIKLEPKRLAPNRTENSVRISQKKRIQLYEGDRIRWTDTDKDRGLINADRARVLRIDRDGITVETSTRQQVTLPHGDRMLQRLDLGYALNAHMAQGLTADRGIAVFDSRERNLTNERLFLVNITRVRDSLELIVDNGAAVERSIVRNQGDKTAALETLGQIRIDRYGHAARSVAPQSQAPSQGSPGTASIGSGATRDVESANTRSADKPAPDAAPRPQTTLPLPVKQLEIDL